MKSAYASVVVRIAATVASVATTLALLAAVVSLSDPQQSQPIPATASRQTATPKILAGGPSQTGPTGSHRRSTAMRLVEASRSGS
jgi:hypothetical protein